MRASKKKSMVRTTVVLPGNTFTQVQALATANDVSTAWVIRHAVVKFLEESGPTFQLSLKLPN